MMHFEQKKITNVIFYRISIQRCPLIFFKLLSVLYHVARHALPQMKLLRFVNNLFRSKVKQLKVHSIFLESVVKIQGVITNE